MLQEIKSNFNLNSDYMRYALRLTISCSLVIILYTIFNLPNGYWAAFSVIACVFPTQGRSLYRAKHRIIGTFLGMFIGIAIAHSLGSNYLVIDTLIGLFIFLAFYSKIFSYQLFALFNTLLTVLFIILIDPGDWQIAIVRLIMTAFGVLIAVLATIYLLPSRASEKYDEHIKLLRKNLHEYYILLFDKNAQRNLKINEISLFKNIQCTLDLLKDAKLEYQNTITEKEYNDSYELFNTLLLLKVHYPEQSEDKTIEPVTNEIHLLLAEINNLFIKPDPVLKQKILNQLEAVLREIMQIRTQAALDLSVPTATQYHRMQITLFIKSMQKIVHCL